MQYVNEIKTLMDFQPKPCVSIYLPLTQGNESTQAQIHLKDLLREAQSQLLEVLRRPDVEELLLPTENFLIDARTWEKRGSGLALFLAPGFFKTISSPKPFDIQVVVGDMFHIKPMLSLLNNPGDFYVLDLDLGKTRLLYGTQYSLNPVELPDTPLSLEEAMQYDDPERQLQFHTSTGHRAGATRRDAQFHGHGGGADDEKTNILRYYHQLDNALQKLIKDSRTPVILAGAEYLTAIFREASDYRYLADGIISGSLSEKHISDIREEAWQGIAPYYAAAQADILSKYNELLGTGKSSQDMKEVILACYHGRVEALFVAVDTQVWGDIDAEKSTVDVHQTPGPANQDLLNLAAIQALHYGATVFALEQRSMPGKAVIAAVFRF